MPSHRPMLHSLRVSTQASVRHCANHPKVETAVSCSNCGKPICPDCMVMAPVGIKCRDCARMPRSARVTLRPQKAMAAVAAAALTGTGCGFVLLAAYSGYSGLGLLTFIAGWLIGLVVGRVTLRFAGYYRASSTAWIAAGGAAWAYVFTSAVIASGLGGSRHLFVQVLVAQFLGLLIAAFVAYREAS